MAKTKTSKFPAWHVYAVIGLAGISVVWSVINWSRIAAAQNDIRNIAFYGWMIFFFEVCFVLGAVIMSVAIGNEIPKYHPLKWLNHIRKLRRDIKIIATQSITSRLFGFGFWLNFFGALGTSSIVIVGIIRHLPFESWGLIALLAVDIIVTFSWRVPLQLMRKKGDMVKKITTRQATLNDVENYSKLQEERWSDDNQASAEQLRTRLRVHPEGMFVAEMGGRVVGMTYAMRIPDYDYANSPSWYQITNNGFCDNHVPDGKVIFGVDLSTAKGVGGAAGDKLLMEIARLAIRNNIKYCMLGGRLPGYHKVSDKMTAEEYLFAKDSHGDPLDPQVKYYTSSAGLKVVKVLPDYFDDPESCDYGVLLRWRNPLYGFWYPHFWSSIFPFLNWAEELYLTSRKKIKNW